MKGYSNVLYVIRDALLKGIMEVHTFGWRISDSLKRMSLSWGERERERIWEGKQKKLARKLELEEKRKFLVFIVNKDWAVIKGKKKKERIEYTYYWRFLATYASVSFYTQQRCVIFRDSSKNEFTVWRLGSVKGVFVIFWKILLYGVGVLILLVMSELLRRLFPRDSLLLEVLYQCTVT